MVTVSDHNLTGTVTFQTNEKNERGGRWKQTKKLKKLKIKSGFKAALLPQINNLKGLGRVPGWVWPPWGGQGVPGGVRPNPNPLIIPGLF